MCRWSIENNSPDDLLVSRVAPRRGEAAISARWWLAWRERELVQDEDDQYDIDHAQSERDYPEGEPAAGRRPSAIRRSVGVRAVGAHIGSGGGPPERYSSERHWLLSAAPDPR